ncbi:MAG: GTP-binding protein [Bacteroidales bacterium]|nr:GTP-binding protein [Bacteroidales bacterium]MDY6405741.1 GTP-binding protein [Bacteroidales bacterium]
MTTINKVPVLLLTGYLGSGKTTLLNRILTNTKGIRFAVIVNDIGEVNIDASLIQQGGVVSQQDDSLVALQNGCICCTLKMDLIQQLHDLVAQKAYDYIVIEASGICEPAPIAQTICSYPEMVPQFAMDGVPVLDCICAVVDALRLRDEFDGGLALEHHIPKEEDLAALVTEQIEFCNIILLNKASEVSEEELTRIKSIIRAIQPTAPIIETNYCDVDLEKLLKTNLFDFDRTATSAAWIQEVEDASHHHDHHDDDDDDDEEEEEHEHEHHHHHHDHDHEHGDHDHLAEFGIDTYVYYARKPFDLGLFDEFVAAHWPKNVIRCKGMCYFAEEYDMCYLFEQAGRQFNLRKAGEWFATMPKEELMQLMADDAQLRKDWDEQYGDRMQKLVFIGQHLDVKAIQTALDNCLQ